jgi:hypothetical protein
MCDYLIDDLLSFDLHGISISIYPNDLTFGISSSLLNVDPLYFLYYEQSMYMRHFYIKPCLLTIFNHDCLFNFSVQHLAN